MNLQAPHTPPHALRLEAPLRGASPLRAPGAGDALLNRPASRDDSPGQRPGRIALRRLDASADALRAPPAAGAGRRPTSRLPAPHTPPHALRLEAPLRGASPLRAPGAGSGWMSRSAPRPCSRRQRRRLHPARRMDAAPDALRARSRLGPALGFMGTMDPCARRPRRSTTANAREPVRSCRRGRAPGRRRGRAQRRTWPGRRGAPSPSGARRRR